MTTQQRQAIEKNIHALIVDAAAVDRRVLWRQYDTEQEGRELEAEYQWLIGQAAELRRLTLEEDKDNNKEDGYVWKR